MLARGTNIFEGGWTVCIMHNWSSSKHYFLVIFPYFNWIYICFSEWQMHHVMSDTFRCLELVYLLSLDIGSVDSLNVALRIFFFQISRPQGLQLWLISICQQNYRWCCHCPLRDVSLFNVNGAAPRFDIGWHHICSLCKWCIAEGG